MGYRSLPPPLFSTITKHEDTQQHNQSAPLYFFELEDIQEEGVQLQM